MSLNEELFKRAAQVIPGGVNSPVRSFRSVGGTPVFIERGAGSKLYTSDGRELIDFCMSWGALLFGHADPDIIGAVLKAAVDGTGFGAATRREVLFAEKLCSMISYVEQVRCVNSGTEAVMTAIRLARGATGRDKILKFDGCYHGHSDSMLVSAGSGLLTGGLSSSAGVPAATAADTLVAPYNDIAAAEEIMKHSGDQIAAIIVEPVAANMGLVPPEPGFLEALRALTHRHGALLIFDEVITGFRFGPTTFGALCGVEPDITCLGKIIGGGLPLAALGGRRTLMEQLAPLGPVYQAGTLSGNPLAVAAGLATLEKIGRDRFFERIGNPIPGKFQGLELQQKGGAFTFFCRKGLPRNLAEAKTCDTAAYGRFFHAMLERGIYLPPAQFETAFISAAHTGADLAALTAAASEMSSDGNGQGDGISAEPLRRLNEE
ncbi:MAG: glutamate-1-semialdehyde 2,1-aminomutase [Pontiellaceae bacterium]|jgi:glutamate-1-semialdehyde 2,1-aminomutase|nr:glutamate-1-semialdehyde 2,1-aminomutase [Pontiellaceae bacterium]